MIKFRSFQLFIIYYGITQFPKTTGHNTTESERDVFDTSSVDGWKYCIKNIRDHDILAPTFERLNKPYNNNTLNLFETSTYDSNKSVSVKNRRLLRDVKLSKIGLETVNIRSIIEDKTKTFDEKAREDGFKVTTPKEFPYAVLLVVLSEFSNKSDTCTGSLLTPRWVLTAAHCFLMHYTVIYVYVGGNSLQELVNKSYAEGSQMQLARKAIIHPKYKFPLYDIALVRVDKSFEMTETVNTIYISLKRWDHQDYKECELTGFGRVQMGDDSVQDYTRKTYHLFITNVCKCLEVAAPSCANELRRVYMCSEPRDDYGICSGDSGGGLICDGALVAVAVSLKAYTDIDNCTESKSAVKCGVKNTLNMFQQVCTNVHWLSCYVNIIHRERIDSDCYDVLDRNDKNICKDVEYDWDRSFDTNIQNNNVFTLSCFLVLLFISNY